MAKTPQERQAGVLDRPVEFRMRFQEIVARAAAEIHSGAVQAPSRLGPYLTISRTAGSGGAEVAEIVGRLLGWSVLDRGLVGELAERLKVSAVTVELMDEKRGNWFRDTLMNLMEPRLLIEDPYVAMLSKVILLAAYEGNIVIVGRGANFILPPDHGLRVRVVAADHWRLNRLREIEDLDQRAAKRRMHEIDRSRAEFVRRHFHHDLGDSRHFDLVLDAGRLGVEVAADLICRALELRGLLNGEQGVPAAG